MPNINELAEEQLKTLPEHLQKAISNSKWEESVMAIGTSHGLAEDKISSLVTEAMLIIYGVEPEGNFKANITRELGLDESTAEEVLDDVEQEAFEPILTSAHTYKTLGSKTQTTPDPSELLLTARTDESNPWTDPNHKAINVLETPKEEPKPVEPAPLPQSKTSIVAENLKTVVTVAPKAIEINKNIITPPNPHYTGGIDPYREPLN